MDTLVLRLHDEYLITNTGYVEISFLLGIFDAVEGSHRAVTEQTRVVPWRNASLLPPAISSAHPSLASCL